MATVYERADGSTIELHECCALLPWQSEPELQSLTDSIGKSGFKARLSSTRSASLSMARIG